MTTTSTDSPTLLLCPACGYDLRGIEASEKCPECGTAIDRSAAGMSRIPWVRRKQIGAWRAYWRTVLMVMFRPWRVAAEIARPVAFEEARRFARRTACLAWTPIALLLLWAWVASMRLPVVPHPPVSSRDAWRWGGGMYYTPSGWWNTRLGYIRLEPGYPLSLGFALEVLVIASLLTAVLLWLILASRSASYFFHPRNRPIAQQNRAVALSYYACAPLAVMPVLTPLMGYALWSAVLIYNPGVPRSHVWLAWTGCVAPVVLIAWCWVVSLILLRRTTRCGAARLVALAAALPVMWSVLATVALSIPAAVVVLAFMVLSLGG